MCWILLVSFLWNSSLVHSDGHHGDWWEATVTPASECNGADCINKTSFTIDVWTFSPWNDALIESGSWATIKGFLSNIINKLIVAFWVLSLFFMTIGAGYMIIYHGQDELLSRWKSIFMAGLISLAVALSAGMMVNFVAYLLYQ